MTQKKNTNPTIAVLGLGYVGLPVLLAFSAHFSTIGFDIDDQVIADIATAYPHLTLTSVATALARADVYIILVPTPTHADNTPDLSCLEKACTLIGQQMRPGATVIVESTVYPGATEEICIPLIEKISGLVWKKDFSVAYSPERINPGDQEHTFANVIKIVAGDSAETAKYVQGLYNKVISVGTFGAPNIRVAEAAKILENVQRDVNIALINEFAMLMKQLGIETNDVLAAASTKWNFLKFSPGLPGGHCIGVDSHYLMHKAAQIGFDTKLIRTSRRVNEDIISYVVECSLAHVPRLGIVNLYGLSFKENIADIRNSASLALIRQFVARGCSVFIHDPLVTASMATTQNLKLTARDDMPVADIIVIAVAHDEYKTYPLDYFASRLTAGGLIADVKSILDKPACEQRKLSLWQL